MIFVTLGNVRRRFTRLVETVDALAASGALGGERVLVQSGHDTTEIRQCERRPFLSMSEFTEAINQATLIITHGGWGTLAQAMRLGKVPVVVPRRRHLGEHVNDHQLELAEAFGRTGRCVVAYETTELLAAIAAARSLQAEARPTEYTPVLDLVEKAIEELGVKNTGQASADGDA